MGRQYKTQHFNYHDVLYDPDYEARKHREHTLKLISTLTDEELWALGIHLTVEQKLKLKCTEDEIAAVLKLINEIKG